VSVAIVTGGGGSIGRAISLRLAAGGASVVVADVSEESAQETVAELERAGGTAAAAQVDVADGASVEAAVAFATERFGVPTVLINNAGVSRHVTLLDMDRETWDLVLGVNLTGVFLCTQAVTRVMVDNGVGGCIVNTASTESEIVTFPGLSHYSASKAGVRLLTKAAALELAPHGIRVNAVGPGWVETNMSRRMMSDPDRKAWAEAQIPLGRVATPDDVADVVAFLASDDARYMTGALVFVDGGVMIGSERPYPCAVASRSA
jgi:NAD(P)-dependent dehydrogenase (short-subunit alcohol dehydrogenase family)